MDNFTTETFQQWLLDADDRIRMKFAINWRMPHTIFNVACGFLPAEKLQNIDWYAIYKGKQLGNWQHGGKAYCYPQSTTI